MFDDKFDDLRKNKGVSVEAAKQQSRPKYSVPNTFLTQPPQDLFETKSEVSNALIFKHFAFKNIRYK